MAKQFVNIGTFTNDGTGDSLRAGGDKINDNFTELYGSIGNGTDLIVNASGAAQGQVLRWNGSNFVPQDYSSLTSSLNVNNFSIISSNNGDVQVSPNGTGDFRVGFGGQTTVFDGSTGHVQVSDKITYKNEYPTVGDAPSNSTHKGFFFTVNGDDSPKVNMNITGTGDATVDLVTRLDSITALSDVDTATTAPTNGQVLKWNSTTTKWEPGDDAAGASSQNLWATIVGDTGSTTANTTSDSLTIAGGTNCTTSISGDTVTVNVDGNFELAELTDVNFTNLTRGDSLTYDPNGAGALGAWVNQPSPSLWYVLSVGLNNNSYLIEGPGQAQTDDPDLHLYRGFTYFFVNNAGSNHPLRFQSTTGLSGSEWTLGVSGDKTAVQKFTVPHSAPNTLYYQCTIHANMAGTLFIK